MPTRHTSSSPRPPRELAVEAVDGLFENGGQNPFRQFNFLMSKTWKYKAVSFESSCGRWWQVNPCLEAGPLSSSPSSAGDQRMTQAEAWLCHISLAGSVSSTEWKRIKLWLLNSVPW